MPVMKEKKDRYQSTCAYCDAIYIGYPMGFKLAEYGSSHACSRAKAMALAAPLTPQGHTCHAWGRAHHNHLSGTRIHPWGFRGFSVKGSSRSCVLRSLRQGGPVGGIRSDQVVGHISQQRTSLSVASVICDTFTSSKEKHHETCQCALLLLPFATDILNG
jgi:hypothetical protein